MAIFAILAVRDRALDAFMQPFFVQSIGVGIRSFSDEVNRAESPMFAHPDDYDLYSLGTYEDADGSLVQPSGPPRQIAIGKDVKRPGGVSGA